MLTAFEALYQNFEFITFFRYTDVSYDVYCYISYLKEEKEPISNWDSIRTTVSEMFNE